MAQCGWRCIGSNPRASTVPAWSLALLLFSSLSGQAQQRGHELWSVDSLSMPLYQVHSLLIVQDTILWLTDGGTGIHRLTTNGRYLGSVGRDGEGPGEFRWPWYIFAAGGSKVGVFDRRLLRVNSYDAGGAYLSTSPLQMVEDVRGRLQTVGASGGSLLVWTDNFPGGEPRDNEQMSYVWSVDASGLPRDPILSFPGPESIILREDGLSSRIDAPFQRRPHVVFLSDAILVGNSGSDSLLVYDRGGRLTGRITLPIQPRPVTGADRQAYRDHQRRKYFDELEQHHYGPELRHTFTARFDRLIDLARYPTQWERYDLLVPGEDGDLWLLLPRTGAGWERVWLEVDKRGKLKRRITILHRSEVICAVVKGDRLYAGEWSEEDYRGRVAAYSLRP